MKSGVWIEAWEAASLEVFRRLRDEWREQAQPQEDGQEHQAVERVSEVGAHRSEPAGAADGSDGQGDGDLENGGVEGHSGHLAAGLHAQDIPGHASAQPFATHAGLTFDGGAVLGRNALAEAPHARRALRDTDTIGESADATRDRDGLFERFHSVVRGVHVVP